MSKAFSSAKTTNLHKKFAKVIVYIVCLSGKYKAKIYEENSYFFCYDIYIP